MVDRRRDYWTGPQFSAVHKDWEMPFLALRELPLIIGIVGPSRVGKTMVARRFVTEQNFHYEKTSSVIREHLKLMGKTKRRKERDGENIHWQDIYDFAETLREKRGSAIVAQTILEKIEPLMKKTKRFVIDGLIHPRDVELVMQRKNVVLLGMVASQEVRAIEASHWFGKKCEDMMDELDARDGYENYKHELIEQYLADENADRSYFNIFNNAENSNKPDVLACFQYVDKENIIQIGNQPVTESEKVFTSEIFHEADNIWERILRNSVI